MKFSIQIAILTFLLQTIKSNAQPDLIYGLAKKISGVKEIYLSTVDPYSGNVTIISNPYITNHLSISSGAAFDNVNNVYYYYSSDPVTFNLNLTAVDLTSGNLLSSTPLNLPTGFYFDLIQFNCNDTCLYGIYRNSLTSQLKLGKLNINTGVFTILSSNSITSGITSDYTYDKTNNTFFFIVNNDIKSFDMINGNLINSLSLNFPAGEYFENIEFNCNDSAMYGTYRDSSGLKFAKVNLATGALTIFSQSAFTNSFSMGGGHFFDDVELKYYFNSGSQIFMFDIITGILINSPSLSFSLPGTFAFLYIKRSMNCDCSLPFSIPEDHTDTPIVIYPNPFTTELFIKTNNDQITEFSFYNITSRKIRHQFFTNFLTLYFENIGSGIYLYEIKNKDGVSKKGKVIKQ